MRAVPLSMLVVALYKMVIVSKVGQLLHDDELHSAVMNILLVGRDTTACAISWAFFEIIKRPHVVQKIVQEVTQICGGTNGCTHDT
eukprot:10121390-Ditylum_brightwellii.AAC.1